jgi:hypothetical protein
MDPPSISKPFFPLSFFGKGAHKLCLPNHLRPLIQTFPSGDHFPIFLTEHLPMTHSGTHAHIQNYQINAHMFDSLQILFTSGIWFSCVQVLGHHTSTQPLQVYTQYWHVVIPSESHLHFQSHPLTFASRIPISGSAVPTPPFASSVLSPGSTLTHMSCPIHSTLLCTFDTHVVFQNPLGMGVPIVLHHVANQPHTPSPHFC